MEPRTIILSRKRALYSIVFVMAFLVLGLSSGFAKTKAEEVVVWSYYIFPPFQDAENQGLTHDFVQLMEEEADGRFHFYLDVMPRKRIEQHLHKDDPGLVLFVSPEWIKPPGTQFVWSEALFPDRNGILFYGLRPTSYSGPEDLYGKRMGGVVGRKYKGLDEAVDSGRIIREDAWDEELNVLKLADGRIDFMTAPESTLRYLVKRLKVEDKVSFSRTPLFEYTRHILIYNTSPEVQEFVLKLVRNLPTNPKWLKLKEKYQLQ